MKVAEEKIKIIEERLASVDNRLSKIDGIAKHMAHGENCVEHDRDEEVTEKHEDT